MWTAKYLGHAINSVYHMQLFITIVPPFRYRAFSWEKMPFCKALFLIFQKQNQSITELEKFSILYQEKACDGKISSVHETLTTVSNSDSRKE